MIYFVTGIILLFGFSICDDESINYMPDMLPSGKHSFVDQSGHLGNSLCFLPDLEPFKKKLVKSGVKVFLPIVIVPGLGGSQLEAIVNRKDPPNPWCEEFTLTWASLWVNPIELLFHDCFIEKISLSFNETAKMSVNTDGVYVRAANFGSTLSVESVAKSSSLFIYMYLLVSALTKLGYERDVNIKAAPFDFRKAANDNPDYIYQLKGLIEMSYGQNYQQKVVIICHSMGCIYSLHFLNQMDQAWKDKFVDSYISVAAPFGGAVEAVDEILSGSSAGPKYVDAIRSMSGILSLLPSPIAFDNESPFVTYENIREENRRDNLEDLDFTVSDFDEIFDIIDAPGTLKMYNNLIEFRSELTHPGVDVYCYYSSNVSTVEHLNYDDSNSDNTFPLYPERVYGDGDGTVNLRSLKSCHQFADLDKNREFRSFEFHNIQHTSMIMHCDVINSILKTLVHIHHRESGNKELYH